jgi:TRAP transporter 4TM/12TM fusion protein
MSALGLIVIINQLFFLNLQAWIGIDVLPENSYFYFLLLLFLPFVFAFYPARKGAPQEKVPWHDVMLIAFTVICLAYLTWKGRDIMTRGWVYRAPLEATIASFLLWFLVIEATRRAANTPFAIIAAFFSVYPLFALHMPGVLQGNQFSLMVNARFHVLGTDNILGVPMQAVCNLIAGFIVFGIIMIHTGAGKFFLDLASSLLGTTRGGPAKVATLSSALFGSLSGSPMSNVVATGSLTIPAMKKLGYPPHYAGAIEACASAGGNIMPPIMGAAAFIMASFLGIPYVQVAAAAAIPAAFYFFGLLVQIDGEAVQLGLKGLSRSDCPPLMKTLKGGWPYLFAVVILIYFLLYLRIQAWAPFYAAALLVVVTMFRRETRLTPEKLLNILLDVGKTLGMLLAVLAGVGLVVGSLLMTGLATSLTRELVVYTGGNLALMLVATAVASFILGMGVVSSAAYVILAIVVAPGLMELGLNHIAVHLFLIYWATVSFITPPVCTAAYVAASIAKSDPLQTGFQATKLGVVKYIVPFVFVLEPALVLQAPLSDIVVVLVLVTIGVFLTASAIQGYLLGLGNLNGPLRLIAGAGGLALAFSQAIEVGSGLLLTGGFAALAALVALWFWRSAKVPFRNSASVGLPSKEHEMATSDKGLDPE